MSGGAGIRRWLRSCAICGQFQPPIDTYCERCWRELGARKNRGIELHQGDRPFPVYALYSWKGEDAGWVRSLIGGFKGGREVVAARVFSEWFSYERSVLGEVRPMGFIPPPRPKRQRDHALVLAGALAAFWGCPVLDLLEYDDGQALGASQKSRAVDLRHDRRFRVREAPGALPKGTGPLVFVDDVITSGATAMAAYMALEDPSRFEVWTLASRPKLATKAGF